VAQIIAGKDADSWRSLFDGTESCVSVVASVDEAFQHPHWRMRGLFDATVAAKGGPLHAIATPLAPVFRPRGEANSPLNLEEAHPRFSTPVLIGRTAAWRVSNVHDESRINTAAGEEKAICSDL
jgi:hypothetical protein